MFLFILTYLNVSPEFLKYVFPFGLQVRPSHLHLMDCHRESRSSSSRRGPQIQVLGRSGREIEICYSLRSVERSDTEHTSPSSVWSITLCTIHHKFDLETQWSSWIVIKANNVIADAVQELAKGRRSANSIGDDSMISHCLAIHELICAWSGDNWNCYISALEEYLRDQTEPALTASSAQPPQANFINNGLAQSPHPGPTPIKSRTLSFGKLSNVLSWSSTQSESPTLAEQNSTGGWERELARSSTALDRFSFRDVQRVHSIEERISEAREVMLSNCDVLKGIRRAYHDIMGNTTTLHMSADCESAIKQLNRLISNIDRDLRMEISRADTLLRIAGNRKCLVI